MVCQLLIDGQIGSLRSRLECWNNGFWNDVTLTTGMQSLQFGKVNGKSCASRKIKKMDNIHSKTQHSIIPLFHHSVTMLIVSAQISEGKLKL